MHPILPRVVHRVSAHEGGYDSLNLNTDGCGLSFGILQWSQRTGALGELLAAMHEASPSSFISLFGSSSRALLELTRRASLEPLDGAHLWQRPWTVRFREAGRSPWCQEVQDRLAVSGRYMQAAVRACRTIDVVTERSLCLTYDTAVQQGPGRCREFATRLSRDPAFRESGDLARLEAYALACFADFQRPSRPSSTQHGSKSWRQVGAVWHLFAGQVDLWTTVRTRRLAILQDPGLGDEPVSV